MQGGEPAAEQQRTPEQVLEALKGIRTLYNQIKSLGEGEYELQFGSTWKDSASAAVTELLAGVIPKGIDPRAFSLAGIILTEFGEKEQQAITLIKAQAEQKFLEILRKPKAEKRAW